MPSRLGCATYLGPVAVDAGAEESLPGQLLGHLVGAELGAHKDEGLGGGCAAQLSHQPPLLLRAGGEQEPLANVGAGAANHAHLEKVKSKTKYLVANATLFGYLFHI